ncbi:MAG: hypothetical protein CMO80_24405, partial [Verrucomicrobiales bacterium]|nr:hypothetical protein [Verrucomicrobiales bacterium]
IAILGNGVEIAAGDTTPSTTDGTDFGAADILTATSTQTFTITNSGNANLTITPPVAILGQHAADFLLLTAPGTTIAASNYTTFQIQFDPSAAGFRNATLYVTNNDANENPYNFDIVGEGVVAPEISISGNGQEIVSGDVTPSAADHTHFGSVNTLGATFSRTYTITNSGSGPLSVSSVVVSGANASEFVVTTSPASAVAAGSSTTFVVTFDPTAPGSRIATVSVASTDPDENPYTFAIEGNGIVQPDVRVFGNGVEIANNDLTPDPADHTDFGDVAVVSASFARVFTITNSGSGTLTLSAVPSITGVAAADYSLSSPPFLTIAQGESTTFTIDFDPSLAGARNATITINSDDPDDPTFTYAITGNGAEPEVAVLGNGLEIVDGDITPIVADGTDFGTLDVLSGSVTHTFVITNSGDTNLLISAGVTITGPAAADFTIALAPASSIVPGGFSQMQVRYDPVGTGTRTATLSFANNDSDETPYGFVIQGNATGPELDIFGNNFPVDDGSTVPNVTNLTQFGVGNIGVPLRTNTFVLTNNGTGTITLSLPVVSAGAAALDFAIVRQPGTDSLAAGEGTTMDIAFTPRGGGSRLAFIVITNDDVDEAVYDFAVGGTGLGPEIELLGNGEIITNQTPTTSFTNHTEFGAADITAGFIDRVFTITNSGTTNLYPGSISFIGAAASDFTVLTNPPASIATNDSAPFAVRFNPSGVGTRSATIQINSDDFDESPYQFAVSGSGFAIPPLPQQQPVGRNVNALETVSFVFLVSGTPTITYQWFRNGVEIPGATSATLTYIQVTGDEAGNYKCVASNAAGSLTSDEVALNVALLPTAVNWSTPPSIVYGTPLGAAQLNATATAAGTITYTPPAGTFLAAGSTDVTANFTPTLANVYLPSSRIVSVTVTPAPLTITADDKSILLGGSIPALTATHSGLVAGDTPASLTTQANLSTTATGSSPVGSYPITISGATSPNYTIMHVIGTLTVFANAPTVDAAPASQTILQGANASFTVLASGTAPLSYQWRKNGVDIPGATTTTLNINNAQSVDEASYDVVITNVGGSVTSAAATLTFSIPPTIITQPQSQTFGALSDVIFTVATAGTTPLSYQWSKDGVDIPGATSSILFLSGVTTNDIGSYRVKVTNVAGMVDSDAAALSVNQLGSGLTWNAPADVPYGTLLNAAQLSAFAAVPGTTAYTPAAGTLLSVGAHTLSVVFTPNDLVNFVPETNTVTLNVTNKILNIIAEGKSREINVPNPALTATFSGFIAGEDTNVLTALPVLSTTADINSFAGLYPITVSGATAPNYQIVFVPSTLTVFANAPSFVTQPASLGVTNGVDVTLFAQTAGSQPQGFQWRLNGTNLPGENATNIVITNIQPALGGLYDVVVSNVAGVVTSELASVVVYVPPAITTPPQSVTVNALTTTTLNVSASGTSPLLFQWKKNGLDILNATNTTLSFPAITSNDAGTYSVAVSNIAGFDISAGALLTVDQLTPSLSWVTPGSITYGTALSTNQLNAAASVPGTFTYTPPLGTFLSAGTHALTVEFQPTDTLNYATNSSTVNINVDPATLVITANSATREFGLANPALTAQFVGFVLGEGPADLATPLVLSITGDVNSGLGAYPITATGASSPNYNITHIDGTLTVFGNQPSVVTPPAPATVSEGSPVGFAVVATGTAPLSYQWRRNGQNIADATNTIYNISSAQPSDAGGYDVVISNVAGVTTSSSATLVVNSPPAITSQPQAQALHVGMTAQFSVLATGSGTLNYQWRKDGVNLPGANAASLSVPGVSTLSAGNYDVVISNVAGSITSSAVALTVDSAPLLAVGPASQSTTASLQLVTLSSTSFGAQPITYYWRHNGLLRTGAGFSGPNVSFINFTTNLGLWELTISNSFGTAVSAPAYVTTPGAPSVLGQPQDATVLEGQTVTFSMLPNGSQPFRVQWLKDGQFLANASGLSLTISNVTALDAGGYTAVIGNTFGFSSSQPATLSVIVPPVILTQPAHQLISVGGVASFGVNVSSVEAVTYQWRKDGSNLVGQTTSGVSVANAQPVDAGNYDVIVANSAGSVTSSVANLTLANPPVLTTQPTSTAVEVATRVELVSLASGSAPLHYQWRLNGVDLFGRTNATMILLSAGRLDRGLYTVWVSNAVGTVESTNASLVVREQQMVETPKLEANGRFAFTFGDKSGGSLTPDLAPNFLIQASSNLIDWITISSNGAGMVYTNGQFRFVDLEAPKKVFRYYRIIEP